MLGNTTRWFNGKPEELTICRAWGLQISRKHAGGVSVAGCKSPHAERVPARGR